MMRDLKECQAEVFRRSNKRIQKRKQRTKHILLACIPVALCALVLLPGVQADSMNGSAPEAAPEGAYEMVEESKTFAIASIRVEGPGGTQNITDPERTRQLNAILLDATPDDDGSEAVQETTADGKTNNRPTLGLEDYEIGGMTSGTGVVHYRITALTQDGAQTEYTLSGHHLQNLTTGNTYTLSEDQLRTLQTLLEE